MKLSIAATLSALFASSVVNVVVASPNGVAASVKDILSKRAGSVDCSGKDGSHCVYMSDKAYIEFGRWSIITACDGYNHYGYNGVCQIADSSVVQVVCEDHETTDYTNLYFDGNGKSHCQNIGRSDCQVKDSHDIKSSVTAGADYNVTCKRVV
ncbi:hypothetical protein D9758_014932 [Tetrapyrgos nigripes]|uniref:Uncharacterized protein n=1 Tax=Tetrapyrgos nigripes TaxID=182062 RepID=A0A8H5CAA8_9AGAR|nr:hypothetical protein D9758_014932 [Tetrapyrgos nigripes]